MFCIMKKRRIGEYEMEKNRRHRKSWRRLGAPSLEAVISDSHPVERWTLSTANGHEDTAQTMSLKPNCDLSCLAEKSSAFMMCALDQSIRGF